MCINHKLIDILLTPDVKLRVIEMQLLLMRKSFYFSISGLQIL